MEKQEIIGYSIQLKDTFSKICGCGKIIFFDKKDNIANKKPICMECFLFSVGKDFIKQANFNNFINLIIEMSKFGFSYTNIEKDSSLSNWKYKNDYL